MTMDSPVQKIKERLGIEEIVSSYIKLERAGANLKAKCPFHNEKTPSFFISPDRGTYYCFGCGASGDIFTFVEEFEGLDFKGALKMLAGRAGVELKGYNREAESEKEKLYRIMEDASAFFVANLKNNSAALEYLASRGLSEKSIGDFEIGFAPADWRELYAHLKTKGWGEDVMEKAGLVKRSEKGFYDRFRGRIMFPIRDSAGRLVAFSGRIFVDDGKSAKYLNSPETPIFSKSSVLYGIDRAKESIRKNNFSILVEGQMDLILSHQAGYKNTVAASGTALSDEVVSREHAVSSLGLVRRLSGNIVLALDGDKAGVAATLRSGRIALGLDMDVKVADLPEGSDPADLIQKSGVEAWKEAIKNSKHLIEFVLHKVMSAHADDPRRAGRELKDKVLPFVHALGSAIERAHFLKKISEISGIPLDALEADLKNIGSSEGGETAEIQAAAGAEKTLYRKDYIKRKLLGIILWQESLPSKDLDTDSLLGGLAAELQTSPEALRREVEESREDLIFEAEVFYGNGTDARRDAEEMLYNLKEETLKDELSRKMKELYEAEESKDKDKAAEIFKDCQVLNQKIQDIKNGRIKK